MPVGDCGQCLILLQNVTLASKRHMSALAQHESAVQNDAPDEEISRLKHELDFWRVERQEAMDRYRFHLRGHEMAAMHA
jgi:hypothetical protein